MPAFHNLKYILLFWTLSVTDMDMPTCLSDGFSEEELQAGFIFTSRRIPRTLTHGETTSAETVANTRLALAYQAHLCSWKCHRDNFTQSLPDTLRFPLLRISCVDCSCNKDCSKYGDCCGNFTRLQAQQHTYECVRINQDSGVYALKSCPDEIYSGRKKILKNNSKNSTFKVKDLNKTRTECLRCSNESASLISVGNKTYCNEHCLQCNERRSLLESDMIWNSTRSNASLAKNTSLGTISRDKQDTPLKERRDFIEHFRPDDAVVRECDIRSSIDAGPCDIHHVGTELTAEKKMTLEHFKTLCELYDSPVISGYFRFNNVFCFLCHINLPGQKISRLKINLSMLTDLSRAIRTVQGYSREAEKKKQEGEHGVPVDAPCNGGYMRFKNKGECREILCDSRKRLSLDNDTLEWTCTPTDQRLVKGFNFVVAWHVLGPVASVRDGDGLKIIDADDFSGFGGHSVTGSDGHGSSLPDEKRKINVEAIGEAEHYSEVNINMLSTENEHFVVNQAPSGTGTRLPNDNKDFQKSRYYDLAIISRRFVCANLAALNVTSFCVESCWQEVVNNENQTRNIMRCIPAFDCYANYSIYNQKSSILCECVQSHKLRHNISEPHTKGFLLQRTKLDRSTDKCKGKQPKINQKSAGKVNSVYIENSNFVTSKIIIFANPTTDINTLENNLISQYVGVKKFRGVNISVSVELSLLAGTLNEHEFIEEMGSHFVKLTAIGACAHVKFNASEVNVIEDGKLIILDLNITLQRYQYHLHHDNTFLVCAKTLDASFISGVPLKQEESSLLEDLEKILTRVSLSISMICLVITLVTYCAIPALRSMPGKNNMVLVISLIVAQTMLIVAYFTERGTLACTLVGVALHYSWLSTIFWMTVCSFHMFHVFVIHQATPSANRSHRSYLTRYFLVVHAASSFVVLSVVASSLVQSSGSSSGYGNWECYLDTTLLVALGFVLPLSVVVVTNIGLFTATVITIARLENVKKHTKREQNNVHVYLRLSALTGITWILALLAAIPGLGVLRCASVLVNGSQGVFLFLSYICNRRAWTLWRNVFSKTRLGSSIRSSQNMTSTTST
ncbi:adhesion G protein-coupled receptor E3 [Biomphalaria pfeifferi]|uniref:Adhesion G protein-coupled receptor E3 n=1 Tax=Biomphalaria pfeifferi TaxID=112525 RepID=A0AAD8BDG0_BIOPF|nr:adhesion G protein-coupled receptor E3 [Biomphalaria pfeifferi]